MADYDLVIVGAGSGNMLPDGETARWRTAIVESDRFGGTCLNRGCLPSKMFVYTAEVANTVRHAGRYGVHAQLAGVDWPAVRDRVFGRIDPLHQQAVDYRRSNGVDVFEGPARFVGRRALEVDGRTITGERFVLAVGSRPWVPPLPGLDTVGFHTSDTVMRLDALPRSMAVLGGGYIAAEMANVFSSFGTEVTIVNRGDALLRNHDAAVRQRFTELYGRRMRLLLGATTDGVRPGEGGGVVLDVTAADGAPRTVEADVLLVATGRIPNSDQLEVAAAGIEVDRYGQVVTDATHATTAPGVWALGDLANHFQLKHVANAETSVVRHNLLHPDDPRTSAFPLVPAAVFADPQVASVGPTEEALIAAGTPYVVATKEYSGCGYGWALEDTTSFVKLLADPDTRLLLGAHILGPQASLLLQPLVQAMRLGTTVDVLAHDIIYIHPALSEVVEQALLEL
jgi:mycothione reductase